jgi:hypothetical protein
MIQREKTMIRLGQHSKVHLDPLNKKCLKISIPQTVSISMEEEVGKIWADSNQYFKICSQRPSEKEGGSQEKNRT